MVVDVDDAFVADVHDERLFARSVRDLRRDLRFRRVYARAGIEVYERRRAVGG